MKFTLQIPTVFYAKVDLIFWEMVNDYIDPMVSNWSNVAEQMSETLKSIESRENKWDWIDRRTIDGRSTNFQIIRGCKKFLGQKGS